MNWINLDTQESLNVIEETTTTERVMIFKFSPGCAINYVVKNLLEREWVSGEMKMKTFLLDILSHKELSDEISKKYSTQHESPQVIILENNKPVFTASHGKILFSEIRKFRN